VSDTEFKVQWSVSLPPAAQYAKGDMLNIRGNSVEEVSALFEGVLDGDSEFLSKAAEVAAHLRTAAKVHDGLNDGAEYQGGQQQQAQQSSPPASSTQRRCTHGIRTRREGDNNRGHWVGYFCPLQKGDPNQCKPEFEGS
jgi:hypothetical protein